MTQMARKVLSLRRVELKLSAKSRQKYKNCQRVNEKPSSCVIGRSLMWQKLLLLWVVLRAVLKHIAPERWRH